MGWKAPQEGGTTHARPGGRLSSFQQQVGRSLARPGGGCGRDFQICSQAGKFHEVKGLSLLFKQGRVRTGFSLGNCLWRPRGRWMARRGWKSLDHWSSYHGPKGGDGGLNLGSGRGNGEDRSRSFGLALVHSAVGWPEAGGWGYSGAPKDTGTFFGMGPRRNGRSRLGCDSGQGLLDESPGHQGPLPAFPPHPARAGLRVEGVQCPHGSTQHTAPGVFSWLLGGDLPTLYPTSAALILTLSKTISLSTIIPWRLRETTGSKAFLRFP